MCIGAAELKLHAFLITAVDEVKWQRRAPAVILLGSEPRGSTGRATGLDMMKKKKIPPLLEIEH
jgi:hypothetical protein